MLKNINGRKVCGACILPASMLEDIFPSHCFDNFEHKTKQLYFGYFSLYKYDKINLISIYGSKYSVPCQLNFYGIHYMLNNA